MSRISIFMYHQVGHFPPMSTHQANYCDRAQFRAQMRLLKRLRLPVLSMSQAVDSLRGDTTMPRRGVVLSFDDGCESFYEHALPELEAFGFPSIVYPVAGLLGRHGHWLNAVGHPAPPLMKPARLRELQSRGVEIGSHGLNHVKLATLPADAQRRELRISRDRLEQTLGASVRHVCYPYGSHDTQTLCLAAEAGYASGVTCQRGAATQGMDMMALPRKAVAQRDNLLGFLWRLYMKDTPKGKSIRRA